LGPALSTQIPSDPERENDGGLVRLSRNPETTCGFAAQNDGVSSSVPKLPVPKLPVPKLPETSVPKLPETSVRLSRNFSQSSLGCSPMDVPETLEAALRETNCIGYVPPSTVGLPSRTGSPFAAWVHKSNRYWPYLSRFQPVLGTKLI
jgi:hypothetical protein